MAQYTQFANSIYRILLKNLIGITGIMGKKKIENRYPIFKHFSFEQYHLSVFHLNHFNNESEWLY